MVQYRKTGSSYSRMQSMTALARFLVAFVPVTNVNWLPFFSQNRQLAT